MRAGPSGPFAWHGCHAGESGIGCPNSRRGTTEEITVDTKRKHEPRKKVETLHDLTATQNPVGGGVKPVPKKK